MSVGTQAPVLKPLKLRCTNTDCENGLHCFLQKTLKPRPLGGPCRDCRQDLIDFPRVQACSLGDIDHTFDSLSKEWIRHEFWERPFDQYAINRARRKGMRALRELEVEKLLRRAVGQPSHPRAGRQTPFKGDVICYAQHSVAACCRKCVEYWHGISMDQPLTDDQVAYLVQLVLRYLARRLPELNEEPMKVPPIRKVSARPARHARLAKTSEPVSKPESLKANDG